MPPRVALLEPPADSRVPRNLLMDEVKLFAPILGKSTRKDTCPPGRDAGIQPTPIFGTPAAPTHRRREGVAYLISRTNSPFAKTRKMKNAMKKAKTFTPMK